MYSGCIACLSFVWRMYSNLLYERFPMEKASKSVVLRLTPSEYAAFVEACNAGARTTMSAVLRGLIYEFVQSRKPEPPAKPAAAHNHTSAQPQPVRRIVEGHDGAPNVQRVPIDQLPPSMRAAVFANPASVPHVHVASPTKPQTQTPAELGAVLDALFDEPDTTDTEGNPPPGFEDDE